MTHPGPRGNSHKERGQGCVPPVDSHDKPMSQQGFFITAY
jgi:hypothetical protein